MVWKNVIGYEDYYEVSTQGEIRNRATLRILKPRLDRAGYSLVTLCAHKTRKEMLVHRVVALAFLEVKEGKSCVNHKNGDKKNNTVDNLEWCSHKENTQHAYKQGLLTAYNRSGSNHPGAKLTNEMVSQVRDYLGAGHTQKEAMIKFNVSSGTMSKIANYKTFLDLAQ